MRSARHAPRTVRRCRCVWPRVLVLLLALFLPAAHAAADVAPGIAVTAETADQDLLESALRLPARQAHRPAARPRPAPAGAHPPAGAAPLPVPPPAGCAPYSLLTRRSVVLRC
ncbi:hypothetical protein GCM10010145_50330 [Streptomyces ruber]|uniref:Secreted protein n=2 Tax=Streptomyces TaxID=1883 RepID=A0A918BK22_9ACTN|nr:hypothetical protein [Streptomyces ruber]GGQ74558.1 hypothetical protein GCM10010145_50330 [Streptomyces ruber]